MSMKEYRDMKDHELESELQSLMKERFNLTIQKATRQLAKPHLINVTRKKIARIKTLMQERVAK